MLTISHMKCGKKHSIVAQIELYASYRIWSWCIKFMLHVHVEPIQQGL